MLNREDIKGLKERIENHDFLPGFEAKALLSHIEELEERLRKAGELAKYVSDVAQCDRKKNCECIGCVANLFLAELSPSQHE